MTEVEEDRFVCLACLARTWSIRRSTPPPNPSHFSWITCCRFNLHLALRWCISATDDGAPTSGPSTLASDVSAGLLNKEKATSEKMCYKNLFQVWLQQRLCAGASADARVVQQTRKKRERAIFSSRRALHFARNPKYSQEWRKMSLLVEQVEWDPVLHRNISRPVEHMYIIYIVYPCKYHVYTWYIQSIFLVYVYITVYTMYIPYIYIEYSLNI